MYGKNLPIPSQRFPRFTDPPTGAFRMTRQVEWRALDVYKHVNNAVYADYMEEAAMQALAAAGWPISRFLEAGLAIVNQHERAFQDSQYSSTGQ